ncbi:MAG: hypothetical protein D3905_01605 [Candidatus Electrothrix sp. AS4_5]|nr:hypothetical protein [Candidatus Electrothrix gigas]
MKELYVLIISSVILFLFVSPALSGENTTLSKKAATLKMGMARQDVITLLGNSSWAVIPTDRGELYLNSSTVALALYWKNTPCSPVAVDFDHNYKVVGWDEGRASCGANAYLFEPSDAYSCRKQDRKNLCE